MSASVSLATATPAAFNLVWKWESSVGYKHKPTLLQIRSKKHIIAQLWSVIVQRCMPCRQMYLVEEDILIQLEICLQVVRDLLPQLQTASSLAARLLEHIEIIKR